MYKQNYGDIISLKRKLIKRYKTNIKHPFLKIQYNKYQLSIIITLLFIHYIRKRQI